MLLAISIASGVFFFQNCAPQPVSSRKSKSQVNCNISGSCYEEESEEGSSPTTTTTTIFRSTTTSSPGTTTTTSSGGSASRAEIRSVFLVQNSQSIPVGGYYSQGSDLYIVVTGRNLTSVRWGPDLTMNCAQSGMDSICSSNAVSPGDTPSGYWASILVLGMNGTNSALSHSIAVASQCHALLGECRLVLQADSYIQGSNPNETISRGRALGVFIATSLNTEASCNAPQAAAQADGLSAGRSFNRGNGSACVFFRAAMPSGQPSDYQCFYVGTDEAAPSAIFYSTSHEVPCNQGRTLQQLNGVTSDTSPYNANVQYIVRHRATNLADVAAARATCTNGVCQISSIKAGHRKALCTSTMCSF